MLVKQVETFRQNVENFDAYLAERRQILKVGGDGQELIRSDSPHSRRSEDSNRSSRPQTTTVSQIRSISERLMPESSTNASSRANSPRGRNMQPTSTHVLAGKLSHLRVSPPRTPSRNTSRNMSPLLLHEQASSNSSNQQTLPQTARQVGLSGRIRIRRKRLSELNMSDIRSDSSSMMSESVANDGTVEQHSDVTLSHILTNVIILREFVLQMLAIVQVRASLFGEVTFE